MSKKNEFILYIFFSALLLMPLYPSLLLRLMYSLSGQNTHISVTV